MKTGILFLTFFAFIACSNSSSEVIDDKEQPKPGQLGQQVDGSLIADGNSAKTYDLIKRSGYDHEAPGYNYNGKLKSAEVLLKEDGSFEVIRRAETPKDYFATLDGTPEYEKMFGNK